MVALSGTHLKEVKHARGGITVDSKRKETKAAVDIAFTGEGQLSEIAKQGRTLRSLFGSDEMTATPPPTAASRLP